MKYVFKEVLTCNMCSSASAGHKILGKRLNRSQGLSPHKKSGITTSVIKCSECSLIYSNPQPISEYFEDHYGIPPETYWKQAYFNYDPNYFAGEIARVKSLYPFKQGDKALDIGAGLGKCMIALENAGFDVQGIEPSEPFYQGAVEITKINPNRLKLTTLEDAVFPENTFQFVTFGAVLEHLHDPSAAILKAMTWLRRGGIMQIEVPSSEWLISKLVNFSYKIRGLDYVTNLSPMHEPFHLFEFSIDSFRRHAQIHGYEIAFFEYYVAQTYLPRMLDYVLVPVMKWTNTGMQLCVWLRKS